MCVCICVCGRIGKRELATFESVCMWLRIRVASDHVSQRVHESMCTKSIRVCRISVSLVRVREEYVFECVCVSVC